MPLLLDTQILIWWLLDDARLRRETRLLMSNHSCMVSVASVWEVAIKHRLGKLPIDPQTFRHEALAAGATLLAITDAHAIETGRLAPFHEDPFDRLLIAQARLEGLMAVSADAKWRGYDVNLHQA